MKIGVELEFFICHKSDETFYMPDIISRYLKYNSGFISMQKDSNGICIKAKNELGVTISFEFTYSIIEFSIPLRVWKLLHISVGRLYNR